MTTTFAPRLRRRTAACGVAAIVAVLAGCGGNETTAPSFVPADAPPPVLVGAGDIGMCGSQPTFVTATLLDGIAGTVFTAGDNAYFHGTRQDFAQCYEPSWGRHKRRTRPSPGNHEYEMAGAAPYFEYFGENAGPAGLGYYSFTVGSWLVLSLNSNIPAGSGSLQLLWLREELLGQPNRCIAAIWHHPLVSSGPNGNHTQMREVWRLLEEFRAELVISGHDHIYERFSPLDADGVPNAAGIREFVAGTGGAELTQVVRLKPGSELQRVVSGVLKLTLSQDSYRWEFVAVPGVGFVDSGTDVCR